MKRCKRCGEVKPLSDFYRESGCRDGHRPECKECNLAARKAKYRENPAKEIARVRAWRRKHREQFNEYQREYRVRRAAEIREGHLRRTFGLTQADYDELLAAQGGGCAVCGEPPPEGRSLHVDHDHATGRVRGLLCFRCNGGLGQFSDDPERLVTVIDYLTRSDELHETVVDRARALRVG
jgi:hypothetical protein